MQFFVGLFVYCVENLFRKVEKGVDNMLKVMFDVCKVVFDMCFIDQVYGDYVLLKVNCVVDEMICIYYQFIDKCGMQLVFIDFFILKKVRVCEEVVLCDLIKWVDVGDEIVQEQLDKMLFDEFMVLQMMFFVYDDFKDKLIVCGILEKEIVFIYDVNIEVQKEEFFGKVCFGRIWFFFGLMVKMGVGINVQN